jgi:hypothetical protein
VASDSLEGHRRGPAPGVVAHELVQIANRQQALVRHPRKGNWNRVFNLDGLFSARRGLVSLIRVLAEQLDECGFGGGWRRHA